VSRREVQMKIVNPNSLAATIDAINDAYFYGKTLPKLEKEKAAKWIAGRQGLPYSYRGLFAPTKRDFRQGFKLFTGERVRTGAATGHILGEEATRALIMLDVKDRGVSDALSRANASMMEAVKRSDKIWGNYGEYCCGICSVAYWRNLAGGGLENQERRLKAGMNVLNSHRDGNGRWKGYPFYYTLLTLSEIDLPSARREIEYSLPSVERVVRRKPTRDKIGRRRETLAKRILEEY
jgi:hypothetical protein